MLKAGVPCVPGWHPTSSSNNPDAQSLEHLQKRADEIGYPLLIKAVSGGGGKGMKIAHTRSEFASQLESAKRESKKSFGDDEVLLERYLTRPRRECLPDSLAGGKARLTSDECRCRASGLFRQLWQPRLAL